MTYFGLPERIVFDRSCQARSPKQSPVILAFPPRMFPVPSYASENFLAETKRWYEAVAKVLKPRLWPKGPVGLVQVDNEAAYYFRDGPYCQDYHPDSMSAFRAWLERKYGKLEALNRAHRASYPSWDAVAPPERFDAATREDLVRHLDWAESREALLTRAIERMKGALVDAGITGVPFIHNVPLGEGGLPVNIPDVGRTVDAVGLDYYHARREHRTIKRRTLYLAGTFDFAYSPELGVGAPPWFTPLAHEDSLYCAVSALAYGLRGFNLYMAVDRDRWYGAPIDAHGTLRVEAGAWKQLVHTLEALDFHTLDRRVEVGLMVPREYARLSRASHALGPISPSLLEAIGGSPVDACREDTFGFAGPVQALWWRMLARFADALTKFGIPYEYVDGDAAPERLARYRAVISPAYEFANTARWSKLASFARAGGAVVFGPAMPTLDDAMMPHLFEVPRDGQKVFIDHAEDAERVVSELQSTLDLATPFRAWPSPIETTAHEDASGTRALFVMNPGETAVDARVALPSPMRFVDAMSHEALAGTESLMVPMPPLSFRMLVVESATRTLADAKRQDRRRVAAGRRRGT
jgi:beta-galactosidase